MKIKIITISREFGSGGRTIGKMVAEKLSFAYYDKDLIEKVAKQTGLSEDYISERGEYASTKNAFVYSFVGRGINGMSADDYLWAEQRKTILELAKKDPCVIIGRCSDYILKDRPDCIHIFIHADIKSRAERIVKLYGETDKIPEKRLIDKDKKRRINYKYYTDREWGLSQNYTISLDSGVIGIEKCVDILVGLVR